MTKEQIILSIALLNTLVHNNVKAMEEHKYIHPCFLQPDGTQRFFYPSKNKPIFKLNRELYEATFKDALHRNLDEYKKAGKTESFLKKYEAYQLNILQKTN